VIICNQRFTIFSFCLTGLIRQLALAAAVAWLFWPVRMPAQTVATGNIAGVVGDAKGNLIAGAKVQIIRKSTGATSYVKTSSEGLYSSGPIQPGEYTVWVEAKGFSIARMTATVHVGNTTVANVTMQPPPEKPPFQAGTPVNIAQPTVQSVQDAELVEHLPISGRNMFDLAQLEPNVQIQDAAVLDATKNGITAISLLSHFGRQTQVTVDGLNIDDEIVGATTQNIPPSAVREFQIAQSTLDLSSGLTSSGAVNVITRSGTDQIHGAFFGIFRGDEGAASLPASPHTNFQQEQYGGNAGGAIIKDKVFWFADAERTQQNLTAAEPFIFPFDGLNASLNEPYRDFSSDERVDWNMRRSARAFARANFFQNTDTRPFSSFSSTQQMSSDTNTVTGAAGVDFNTGVYAHSLRFEYLKLRSHVDGATGGLSGVDNPIPGLGINIGAYIAGNCVLSGGGSYCGGPSWLGPERNVQADKMGRYDGSRVLGAHNIRYGATFNRIDAAHVEAYSVAPQVGTVWAANSTSPDPTSYPANYVSLGNGIAAYTNQNTFGLRGGGLNPDNRIEAYVADAWKATPKLTLTYGLHYGYDTGRTDSNLGSLPALNQWGSGYAGQIRNPNADLAPQFGFAWDASGNGKTVFRLGAGLYYANTLWSNMLFDAPARLANGAYADTPQLCSGAVPQPFTWPTALVPGSSIAGGAATAVNSTTALPNFCGGTIATVAPGILALSSAFQAAAATVTPSQPNNGFVGAALKAVNPSYDLLYPGYLTPRSYQMNFGVEEEIRPGAVLSIDYVRNISEHFLIGEDINHSGAARSFNQANAIAARDAAQVANGCAPGLAQATCMIGKLGQQGAQEAYSRAGLDSNLQAAGGGPCPYCAFPGTNPISGNLGSVGALDMLFPDGHSLYTGFQVKLVQKLNQPWRGVKGASFQVSFTYSKFISQVQDQGIVNLATDNDNPTRFTGTGAMDRKYQISYGGTFDLPFKTKLSLVGHFFSPLSQSLLLPELTNGGEIFATDWIGSGLGAQNHPEPLPGTNIGQFQRATTDNTLPAVISTYNHDFAGKFTPAGACLVGNSAPNNPFSCPGLVSAYPVMTTVDMAALGWVLPTVNGVAPEAVGIPWLKTLDMRVSWPFTLKDRVTIEPSATVFNVFNFWNASLPGNLPSASLIPGQNGILAPNSVGGIIPGSNLTPFRASFQSGSFALGAPRSFQFGLRVSF
jgi:hypothetical protein